MHTLRRKTPGKSERNPISCLRSHQSEQQRFSEVEKEISEDWRDIEAAKTRHDTAHRREDRLAQQIAPAHPNGERRDRQPGADGPNPQPDFEERERPADDEGKKPG